MPLMMTSSIASLSLATLSQILGHAEQWNCRQCFPEISKMPGNATIPRVLIDSVEEVCALIMVPVIVYG